MSAEHGGNRRALAAASGRHPNDILDFSANVNPLGPPPNVARVLTTFADDPVQLSDYPDPSYERLRSALANRHGIAAGRIVVGNGSAALVGAIVRALRPERCIVPVPAFSEYRKALADADVDRRTVPLDRDTYRLDCDTIVRAAKRTGATLCIAANPNNPTGALTPRSEVVALAHALDAAGCTLLIDEAFIDYVPDETCVGDDLPAIVLRSLTKFFGIPGVRVGYAVASVTAASAIAAALPSWPVGTIDAAVAIAAIADDAYPLPSREENARERERFACALRAFGFTVASSAANFLFIDSAPLHMTAAFLTTTLLHDHGISLRNCDDYEGLASPTFVRVAVRSQRDDDRLLRALEAAISQRSEKRTSYPLDDEEPS